VRTLNPVAGGIGSQGLVASVADHRHRGEAAPPIRAWEWMAGALAVTEAAIVVWWWMTGKGWC